MKRFKSLTLICYEEWRVLRFMVVFAVLLALPFAAQAVEKSDSLFKGMVYFHKSSAAIERNFSSNRAALDSIGEFLRYAKESGTVDIEVYGSSSPEGKADFNQRLARRRASSLIDVLKQYIDSLTTLRSVESGIAPDQGRDMWPLQRYASIRMKLSRPVVAATAEVTTVDSISDSDKKTKAEQDTVILIDDSSSYTDNSLRGGVLRTSTPDTSRISWFLSTNLLYDAALVPNIGAGIYLGRHISLFADWMYAWWSNSERHRYWRVYGGDIEARYQFGHGCSDSPFAGHYVGVYGSLVTYDFQFGNRKGVIGDKFNYAVGFSYGYSLPVNRRLNINFSLGIGYMWGKYKKHHPVDECDVWISDHKRKWFGPTRLEIGLVWLLGRGNINSGKDGVR